jgi:hypothetical protein
LKNATKLVPFVAHAWKLLRFKFYENSSNEAEVWLNRPRLAFACLILAWFGLVWFGFALFGMI